jgi:mono/diheme cytochrome c family protein
MAGIVGTTALWLSITIGLAVGAFASVQDLPEGYGKSLLEGNCTGCHTLDRIVEKHWDAQGWQDAIAEMREKGSTLAEEDVKDLVDYLAKNFGVRPTDATPAPSDAQTQRLFEDSCTSCHGVDLIEANRMNKDGWTSMVQRMMALGAMIAEPDVPKVIDYLAKTYASTTP